MAGLRYRLGSDTPNYLDNFYYEYPKLSEFSWDFMTVGSDPLYKIINSIVISLGWKFYVVQLIESFVVNFFIFKYIKKHCDYIFTCYLFYFLTCYFLFTMEIMRAAFSIVLSLYAYDFFQSGKWLKGFFLIILAIFFHAQSLLLILAPSLMWLRFNKKGVLFLLVCYSTGKMLQPIIGDYLLLLDISESTDKKLSYHLAGEQAFNFFGNFNYFSIHLLPLLIYTFFSLYYLKYRVKCKKTIWLEPLVMVGVAFILCQASMPIFSRYVDYYRIYFVIAFSEVFVRLSQKNLNYKIIPLIVFLPFYFSLAYIFVKEDGYKYYPYSSVIDKKLDKNRERHYNENNRSGPSIYEY